ncbi:T9SS type A sorting domain-containing protein [Emticicia sp. SJ17W-69]|uniref:T9SS type A sorting domain-containing protein n=1 Tax=Emticicia sp. SJ17W-69 TaxID=3421657 RepID=UPI003EBD40EB
MQNFQGLLKRTFGNLLVMLLLFSGFILLSSNNYDLQARFNPSKGRVKLTKAACMPPVFTLRSVDVTLPNVSDAKLIISNIQNAKRYTFFEKGAKPAAYANATLIDPIKKEIEIKGLANPESYTSYTVRMYNSETCFAEQTITLEHVNFATLAEYSLLELIQAVDNHNPQVDETVTFTTIIMNKGSKVATGVDIQTLLSSSLKIVYYYSDKGAYDSNGGLWSIGAINGGETIKLVVKAKVTQQGLSYLTSYIWKQNGKERDIKARNSAEGGDDYGVSCVSVPISLKRGENYKVALKSYAGVKWYYKNVSSGVYEEINKNTSPDIATVNSDSSLNILRGGEYTFSKLVGSCNVGSCCPITVEGCSGPKIIIDSIYCNKKVDSYNIRVKLLDDDWSIVQQIYAATSNIGFPTTIDYLKRLNRLPLQSSAGYVVANGNSFYTIENIPAFMPNVTLVATDISGKCSSNKIVNAPNCNLPGVQTPLVLNQVETFTSGAAIPTFNVISSAKGTDVVWFDDENATKPIATGSVFTPTQAGTYFVAARDRKTKALSTKRELTMTEIIPQKDGKFKDNICKCESVTILPDDDFSKVTITALYPNPADDHLTLDYNLPESLPIAKLVFFNLSGTVVASFGLENNDKTIKVSTLTWNEGTYFYQLSVNGRKMASNKFLVMHN